jgi:hypothetical protein
MSGLRPIMGTILSKKIRFALMFWVKNRIDVKVCSFHNSVNGLKSFRRKAYYLGNFRKAK